MALTVRSAETEYAQFAPNYRLTKGMPADRYAPRPHCAYDEDEVSDILVFFDLFSALWSKIKTVFAWSGRKVAVK